MSDSVVASLVDSSRPSFLFGCCPPASTTSEEDAKDIAKKFADRGRVLAVDGYVCYDVQDESSRDSRKRPFPYRPLMDSSRYARFLSSASHKECVVYKAVTVMESTEHYKIWLDKLVEQDRHRAINVVGAPSSDSVQTGPSTKEASMIAANKKGVRFGAVAIAERHVSKGVEHVIMCKKASWGAEWFITQGIYDPEPMIQLIKDYARLCKDENQMPKKIMLTFTPCGRRKTMDFIKWLGMQVTQEAEDKIFAANEAFAKLPPPAEGEKKPKKPKPCVELSCELMCDNLTRILKETSGCGVPLGINVESVSGFKDEIDATHDLFRSLQAILLDASGTPWVMRWNRLDHLMAKRASMEMQRRSLEQPRSRRSVELVRQVSQAIIENTGTPQQATPMHLAIMMGASTVLGAILTKVISK